MSLNRSNAEYHRCIQRDIFVRGPLDGFNIVASRVVGRSTVFALVSLKVLPDPSLEVDLIVYRGDTGAGRSGLRRLWGTFWGTGARRLRQSL
jgi:hypothetical protein